MLTTAPTHRWLTLAQPQGDDQRFLGQSYCAHLLFVAQAICMQAIYIPRDLLIVKQNLDHDVGW